MNKSTNQSIIRKNLLSGEMSLEGFLGNDERDYLEIIEDDRKKLTELGLTTTKIADRLLYFTDKTFELYGGTKLIDDIFEVSYRSFRGRTLCPFAHHGRIRKGLITLINKQNNLSIFWTPLNIHMIREHCFFEGKGSKHRLEPNILKEVLF
ncbi:MAG: hypothetical protein H8E57_00625 [Candidatus Cloacimonetes bacterium]|nr:hypothetical protein [Candidatus Cloacimonadota bacterium]